MYCNVRVMGIFLYMALFLSFQQAHAEEALQCGIAKNYPPYQFETEGKAKGFDADVLRLVAKHLKQDITFYQKDWDHVFTQLRMNKLDCITGMEINDIRRRFFLFTQPYYARQEVILVRADNTEINVLEDLEGKMISGDKHSQIEEYLEEKGMFKKARLIRKEDKEKAMQLLKEGKVDAVITPRAVGMYTVKKYDFKVKTIFSMGEGTPVGLAFHKKNAALKERVDAALGELIEKGEISKLYTAWFN